MFRVAIDKEVLNWKRENNKHRWKELRAQYAQIPDYDELVASKRMRHVVARNLDAAKEGERVGKAQRKISTRVALIPKEIRDNWKPVDYYEPPVMTTIKDLPMPGIGHNGAPEPIEVPEDDSLAKDENPVLRLDIPAPALFLLEPRRYKVIYGGRGSGKSWSIARCLIVAAHMGKKLILCVREFQNSISDSVHRLLAGQIDAMGLTSWFDIQKNTIVHKHTGSEFIFKGMNRNIQEIKSTEGVDICWLEEAQSASEESLRVLIPTIRGSGERKSEIWISFNPYAETDPIYKRFGPEGTYKSRSNTKIVRMNWNDNPWFPTDLEEERVWMLNDDPDAYDHVYEGHPRKLSSATILRGKFRVEPFETPTHVDRFYYGVDWGFATDPSVMTRSFIKDNCLFIDYEAYGFNIDIEQLGTRLFDKVPGSRVWPIKADSSRPETISYMRRQGFNIDAAEKWPGSVEDGIAHLRGFDCVVIHERCVHTAQEARLYSYKVDKKTNDVLPIIEDKHNHCIDSLRYGLDGYIQARGGIGVWLRLARAA